MVALNKLPHDDLHPVIQALGKAGFDERMAESIRQNPSEANSMVAHYLLRKKWYLTPPLEQIEVLRLLGFWDDVNTANKMLARAKKSYRALKWPFDPTDITHAPVLVPWSNHPRLGCFDATLSAMFQAFRRRMHNTDSEALDLRLDHQAIDDLEAPSRGRRGRPEFDTLAWVLMDLTAVQNEKPDTTDKRMGAMVMAAAATHPIWVMAINGRGDIPFTWIPGCPDGPGRGERLCLLLVSGHNGTHNITSLGYGDWTGPMVWFGNQQLCMKNFSVPKILEVNLVE